MPKAKKDPNRPKGVKSAYICFTEQERKDCEERGEQLGFRDFSVHCGTTWKSMSDATKKQFVALSEKDRKRHEAEMENYNPPSDSDSEEDRPKKKKKKEKDPNAPKKPITAYFHFAAEQRPIIKADTPGLAITEVAVAIGAKWRDLTAEEKVPFERLASKDKARYKLEMEAYKK